jgi:hypothetical protein
MKGNVKIGTDLTLNRDWPCINCNHVERLHEKREYRRIIDSYTVEAGHVRSFGPTYTQVFCHGTEHLEGYQNEMEVCGCSMYQPTDNLRYLESMV